MTSHTDPLDTRDYHFDHVFNEYGTPEFTFSFTNETSIFICANRWESVEDFKEQNVKNIQTIMRALEENSNTKFHLEMGDAFNNYPAYGGFVLKHTENSDNVELISGTDGFQTSSLMTYNNTKIYDFLSQLVKHLQTPKKQMD